MIYLYGLTDAPDTTAISGHDGVTGPVQTTALTSNAGNAAPPVLIYGEHDGGEIRAKRKALLAHARVLETALANGTVLPMRFGLVAQSLAEVSDLVAAKADVIADHFERLKGLVELGIRITYDTDQALAHEVARHPNLAAERSALAAARRHDKMAQADFGRRVGEALDRHRTDCQRALIAALKPDVTDLIVRTPEAEAQLFSGDVLLPASAQEGLAERLETLARDTGFLPGAEAQIRIVGPVPPYSFVRFDLGRLTEAA